MISCPRCHERFALTDADSVSSTTCPNCKLVFYLDVAAPPNIGQDGVPTEQSSRQQEPAPIPQEDHLPVAGLPSTSIHEPPLEPEGYVSPDSSRPQKIPEKFADPSQSFDHSMPVFSSPEKEEGPDKKVLEHRLLLMSGIFGWLFWFTFFFVGYRYGQFYVDLSEPVSAMLFTLSFIALFSSSLAFIGSAYVEHSSKTETMFYSIFAIFETIIYIFRSICQIIY